MPSFKVIALAAGGIAAACAAQGLAQQSQAGLPEGPDRALVEKTCTACHVSSQFTAQRKAPGEWAATVDQMIGYGAVVSDQDYPKIVAYLSANFSTQ